MSKVVRHDGDNLSAVLELTVTQEDYLPKLNSELNAYRKKVQMKGFRKGKTPMSYIKKMYGREILSDILNELIQKEIAAYLANEKLQILGQPLPSDDQEKIDFNVNEPIDYTFKFDIGLAPEFEIEGLTEDDAFERYAAEVKDELIEKDIEVARKRMGTRKSVDDEIEENDVITFDAEELEGDEIKENGWASTFEIHVDYINDENLKKELIGKGLGTKVRFNIFEIEKNSTEESVRKYLLNVEESDEDVVIGEYFEGEVKEIKRLEPAELNQEFFDKMFSEAEISSLEELKTKIESEIVQYYDRQSEQLLYRDFQDHLLEKNQLELPHEFLKRWLQVTSEEGKAPVGDKEYETFTKNIQWSLVRSKIINKFDLIVEEDDIFEGFKQRVRNYFHGGVNELVILNTANRLMDDQHQVEQLSRELMSDKVYEAIRSVVTVKDKKIDSEEFDQIISKAHDEIRQQLTENGVENNDAEIDEPSKAVTEDMEKQP